MTTTQGVGGGLMLALGLAVGVAVAPGEPQHVDNLPDVAERAPAEVPAGQPVDVAEYHRVVHAARAGRGDITDMLTAEVPPTETVTTSVSVEPGARPKGVKYTGAAAGKFETASLTFEDRSSSTTIILTARNTSGETLRLTALVHYTTQKAH